MNVLIIGFDSTIGSEETESVPDSRARHLNYARALDRKFPGSKIVVLTRIPHTHKDRMAEEDNLEVHSIASRRAFFALNVLVHGIRLLRQNAFDLISTQTPFDDGLVGLILSRLFDVPFNVQMHSSFLGNKYWIAERRVLYRMLDRLGRFIAQRASSIRTVSYGEKDRLQALYPSFTEKTFVIPVHINKDSFLTVSKSTSHDELNQSKLAAIVDDKKIILFAGRLVKQKNLPLLLEAFQRLLVKEQFVLLAIAGDGPLRGELEKHVANLGLDDHLLWLGHLNKSDLITWYHAATCTVLPSYHEGFGRVIIESYLCGTPVIATPFVSAQELIKDGVTGFIVTLDQPDMLADRMLAILASEQKADDMGGKGRDWILKYLGTDEAYYEKLVAIWTETASL